MKAKPELLFAIECADVRLEWRGPQVRRGDDASDDTEGWRDGLLRVAIAGTAEQALRVMRPTVDVAPDDVGSEVGPLLYEETRYDVHLRTSNPDVRVALRHQDPSLLREVHQTDGGQQLYGGINFKRHVGDSRFEVLRNDEKLLQFEVEVVPSKLDYKSDYEQLIADVQDTMVGLVLAWLRSTWKSGQVDPARKRSPTDLEWLLHLGVLLDDLEMALGRVAAQPIRSLSRDQEWQQAERIRRPTSGVRAAIRKGHGRGPWVSGGSLPIRRSLLAARTTSTLDTPEHRWLQARVQAVRRRLGTVLAQRVARQAKSKPSARSLREIERLEQYEARVARLERLEPLAAATAPPPPGFSSLKLQSAPGYAEAARILLLLELGLQMSGGALELSLGDLAQLYEVWCFLAVVQLVSEMLNMPCDPHDLVQVEAAGLRVLLTGGKRSEVRFDMGQGRTVRVAYQETFSTDVLFQQKPDIVVAIEAQHWPTLRLIMDAKYRLDASDQARKRYGGPAPPQDALGVLYRYRDAILSQLPKNQAAQLPESAHSQGGRSVVQAVALYPWRVPENERDGFARGELWSHLKRTGVGAVPLLPSDRHWLATWLGRALRQSPWDMAEQQTQAVGRAVAESWVQAASQGVLVGTLRGHDPAAHLAWCREHHCYYLKRRKRQPRQARVRFVALYEPSSISPQRGRVFSMARVVDYAEVQRGTIETPWPARRKGVVARYTLSEWVELPHPINAPGPGRGMRQERWTSRLGLERAETLDELALETVQEWQLVDALRSASIAHEIRAGRIRDLAADQPGHGVIRLSNGAELRWLGPAGFRISAGELTWSEANVKACVAQVKWLLAREPGLIK